MAVPLLDTHAWICGVEVPGEVRPGDIIHSAILENAHGLFHTSDILRRRVDQRIDVLGSP